MSRAINQARHSLVCISLKRLPLYLIADNSANVPGGGFVALNGDITATGGGPVSTPEPSSIVSLIAVGALGAASLRRRG